MQELQRIAHEWLGSFFPYHHYDNKHCQALENLLRSVAAEARKEALARSSRTRSRALREATARRRPRTGDGG